MGQVIHENTDYQLLFIEYWLRAARNRRSARASLNIGARSSSKRR